MDSSTCASPRARICTWRPRRGRAPRSRPSPPARPPAVAAFVHAAFWRGHEEQYVGAVLRELEAALSAGGVALVGLGPETSYRARAWHHRVSGRRRRDHAPRVMVDAFASRAQLEPSRGVWRRRRDIFAALAGSRELRQAAVIRGCDAWPLIEPALMGIAYLQFPWSAQVMDELGAALDAIKPSVVMTYAEAGGWGRALVLEARRRGIASAGLQHGFIYRHWLNYLHEPDEMAPSPGNPDDRGFPRPSLTLRLRRLRRRAPPVGGPLSARRPGRDGQPAPGCVRASRQRLVTPDDMERTRAGRGRARRPRSGRRRSQVHADLGRVPAAGAGSLRDIPGVRLVVKCHPAETAAPYLAAAGGATHVAVAPAGVDLAELTRIARLLVTVNSTAAIEAMVLDVPASSSALPNNLSRLSRRARWRASSRATRSGRRFALLLVMSRAARHLVRQSAAFMARYRVASDGGAARTGGRGQIVRLASGTNRPRGVS